MVGTDEISAEEAADRAAIEKVWLGYWELTYRMQDVPAEQRRAEYSKFLVDPELTTALESAALNDEKHWANYGEVLHHIRWTVPVDGEATAVLTDCQDQSEYGAYDTRTDKAFTRGPDRVNQQATFKRTDDGWRLAAYFDPPGTTCER